MKRIVRLATPAALLKIAPHLLGHAVERSVLMVPFRGSRSLPALRADVPEALEPRAVLAWSTQLTELAARRDGVDGIAVIVYSDDQIGRGALPHVELVAALKAAIEARGLRLVEALWHGQDAWGDYRMPHAARGPLAELDVLEQPQDLPPLEAVPALPAPASERDRAEVAVALERLDRELDAFAFAVDRCEHAAATPVVLACFDPPLHLERAVRFGADRGQSAVLIRVLQGPLVRDLATAQLLDGLEAGIRAHRSDALAAEGCDVPEVEASAQRLLGAGPAPDPGRIRDGIRLMEQLVGLAPEDRQPPLMTILGWLHWCLGRGSVAGACVDAALEIAPGYGMATVLGTMLDAHLMPEWVTPRASSVTASAGPR